MGYKYSVSDCIKGASVILHYPPPASTGSGWIDLASCLVRAGLQKQDTAAVRAKTGSAGRSASCSFSVHAVNTSRLLTALTRDEEEAVMCDWRCDSGSTPWDQFRCAFQRVTSFKRIESESAVTHREEEVVGDGWVGANCVMNSG